MKKAADEHRTCERQVVEESVAGQTAKAEPLLPVAEV